MFLSSVSHADVLMLCCVCVCEKGIEASENHVGKIECEFYGC